MEWNNLQKCLEEYSMYLLRASQENMPTYYALRETVSFYVEVSGSVYEINFKAPEYWKWANDGRGPGKMPPKAPIDDWIERRRIVPYAMKNGKLPTKDQLSFLIRRKIGRDGTEGVHFLDKSVEDQKSYWDDKISTAIGEDIAAEIATWLEPTYGKL